MQPYAGHLAWVYQIELLLCSLVMLLFALWWGFRMAKGVTHSIRALAEGTAEVARGNLDVAVEPQSDDEVGFLVRSFNRMTRDLREARGVARAVERRSSTGAGATWRSCCATSAPAWCRSTPTAASARSTRRRSASSACRPARPRSGHKLEEVVTRPEYLEVVAELVGADARRRARERAQAGADPDAATRC